MKNNKVNYLIVFYVPFPYFLFQFASKYESYKKGLFSLNVDLHQKLLDVENN